ncbi:ABC transporter ATP-binding protein [Devosia oryziradicis]|uniref:ABC transporter ATP-binding protein n=1 Tax=Devosia oryziradicis TaxID=2801335 RepID=A0ABX7C089_9HYPH|nr:ABC transporter ATP-binding protein [Devosia oryziradicis]QQR37642.1 ABC transporter ATP-binding protein [Devosia oryziradicis]
MAPGPGLSIDIADKRFAGAAPLLADFRLDIVPGSVVALFSPSGIGKSTLLRLIAGIDRDFIGSITIDGAPAHQAPPPGYVFQDPRLLPWLTARDNVRAASPAISAQTADAALARVGLADDATAWPHALSGGMQRRVALARAIATNPRLLLLDEPFVSLDRALVDDMHRLIANLAATSGATVIFASHQPEDASRLATRVITLAARPATIAHDLTFEHAPGRRDDATIAAYASQLATGVPHAALD